MTPPNIIQSLASALIGNVGTYFESITASPARPLSEFNPGESHTSVYVVYAATGQPLAAGHAGRSNTRGRQAPPEAVAVLRGVPGTTHRLIEVGDEQLAAHLSRIINELFASSLPFSNGDGAGTKVVVNHEEQVTETPRRRGRKPGRKPGAKRGRKPGRRVVVAQDVQQERGVEAAVEQPKRRGRKPGSKNKPKVTLGGVAASDTPKRRPGRPRKNA